LVYLVLYHNLFNSNPEKIQRQQQENFANQKYQNEAKNFLTYFENFIEKAKDSKGIKGKPLVEPMSDPSSLKLFYTPTCPHSLNFLPIWKQLTEILSNTEVEATMINCKEDSNTCRQYGIKGVPSLVFNHKGDSNIYRGEMSYQSVIQMIKEAGVRVPENTIEGFTNYITMQDELDGNDGSPKDRDCPPITFSKDGQKSFCASSNYINGCLELSDKDTLKPFDGAFSVIGSYLLSVPNRHKMTKCAVQQKETIRNWLLCNAGNLNEKVRQNPENASIVSAIKKSCTV